MIGKRAKMGAWGDPPNFVAAMKGDAAPTGAAVARGLHTAALGSSSGGRRSYHTTSSAAQHAQHATKAAAAPGGGEAGGAKKGPSPVAGSDVPRVNIGVFGVMNAGKSTLINSLTRQVGCW